jgi:chromosome partitioning protein
VRADIITPICGDQHGQNNWKIPIARVRFFSVVYENNVIITLASLKGGTGKTILSLHIAHAIALAKKRVLLIDADPQGSASNWAAARETTAPFVIVGMARENLHKELAALAQDFDHCVIDTAPRVSALARSAILAADIILCPLQPSSFDVWAVGETATLIEEAQQFKPDIKAGFIVNRKIANSTIGQEVAAALQDYEFPVLKTAISQRVAFAEAAAGYSVLETLPTSPAAKEIQALSKDILNLAGTKKW